VDLLSQTLAELMTRTGVAKKEVEDVVTGCVTALGEQGGNIGRLALLKAGFPVHVPSVQLNRMCGSSQQAIHFAAQAIASGQMDCVIACGIEMMGKVTMGSDFLDGNPEKILEFGKDFPYKILHQGQSAELMAESWNLSRDQLDKFSGSSHEKCALATENGYFKREIMPMTITKPDGSKTTLDKDEGIRVPVDYKKMATLKTPFKHNGHISAANASQVSDGAAAVLLCSAEKCKQLGLQPRARIVACSVIGSDPELMLSGPIAATRKVLQKARMSLDQINVFEINEAFASVVLAWQKELNIDMKKVNPNGGAIAHGHPLGATGCILMTKLVHELERSGKRFGLQTMCIGHGQATATIIENVNARSNL